MKNKLLIIVNSLSDCKEYEKVGINTFLFPLKDYTVGYKNTFKIEEINQMNGYCLINRLLDSKAINELKEILPTLKIKGLVFEDIGLFNLVKRLKLNIELILFQNHFGTNTRSVNFWLNQGVDSLVLSNELTIDELSNITKNTTKPCIVHLLGYNQLMYSRRKLLSNYYEKFNITSEEQVLEEKSSKYKFQIVENDYGTVLYSNKLFYDHRIKDLENVKYFIVNSMFLDLSKVLSILENNEDQDKGFLDQETIFKLKGTTK